MRTAVEVTEIPGLVEETLAGASAPGLSEIKDILSRAEGLDGLSLADCAALLMAEGEESDGLILDAAARVKDAVFGPRVVLFAPLYLSNHCANDCLYCGFRRSNTSARRKALAPAEAASQAGILARAGFRRLLLVAGEHPARHGVDYLAAAAREIYEHTDIRILHINSAPLTVEDFRELKGAGFGVYQCFQETYHPQTYARMHPAGRKKDYAFRLGAMDRALEAGFGDVGLGALLGLYDHRYDALAVIAHSRHLEAAFGAAAHTISVPRLRPAEGSPLTSPPYPVSDAQFKRIVAVYRLAVPYAGVVVSTREPAALREEVLKTGASQVSAGSSTEPGGYGSDEHSTAQFDVFDHRDLSQMVAAIVAAGCVPSLCTACYRSGRQGQDYLHAASSGAIREYCTPNALISMLEYALDSAGPDAREMLLRLVDEQAGMLEEPVKSDLLAKLVETRKGGRDLHY